VIDSKNVCLYQCFRSNKTFHYIGGGPAKQRRLERRAAARKATAAAEKAAEYENREQSDVDKEALAKQRTEEAEDAFEKVTDSPIPQVDGTSDSNICYEFRVEAHTTCTHEDILESIETNFLGCLDDEKVDKDAPVRYLVVRESKESNQNGQNIRLYKVTVTENEIVKRIIESWNTGTFDDLAFKKAVRDEIVIKIQAVQRLW
jgi:hypothetical protein